MYCDFTNQLGSVIYNEGAPSMAAPSLNMISEPMYCAFNKAVQTEMIDDGANNIYYNPYYQAPQAASPITQANTFPPSPGIVQPPPYGFLQQNTFNPYPQQTFHNVQELYKPPALWDKPSDTEPQVQQMNKTIPFGLPTDLGDNNGMLPVANTGEGYKQPTEKQQVFYSASGIPYSFNLPQGAPNPLANPFAQPVGMMGSYYTGNMYQDPYAYANFLKQQEEAMKQQRTFECEMRKKMLKNYYAVHNIEFTPELEKQIDEQNERYINPPPPRKKEQWEINQEQIEMIAPYLVPCTPENPNWDIWNERIQILQIQKEAKRLNPDNIGVVEFFNEYAGLLETEAELLESKRQRNKNIADYDKDAFRYNMLKAMTQDVGYNNDESDGERLYKPKVKMDEDGKRILEIKGPPPSGVIVDKNGDEWMGDMPLRLLREKETRRQQFFDYCLKGEKDAEAKLRAKGVKL